MKFKLEQESDYEQSLYNDPIALLKRIKKFMTTSDETDWEFFTLWESLRKFVNTVQGSNETPNEFRKRFEEQSKVVKALLGDNFLEKFSETTQGYDVLPGTGIDGIESDVQIQYKSNTWEMLLASGMLYNSDRARFQSRIGSMNANYMVVHQDYGQRMTYPTTVHHTTETMNRHKADNRKSKNGKNVNNNGSGGQTGSNGSRKRNSNHESSHGNSGNTGTNLAQTFKSPRQSWVKAIKRRIKDDTTADRVFIGLVCMILSPMESDRHLLGTTIETLPYTSPAGMFEWAIKDGGWSDGRFVSLVTLLASKHACAANKKKSNFIVFTAIIFLLDRDEAVTPAGMKSLLGVSLKVLFETQQGMLDHVLGIGCDSHMLTIFSLFGWIAPAPATKATTKQKKFFLPKMPDHDKAARQMMAWVPQQEWKIMNCCYAGLGQMLQSKRSQRNLVAQALRKAFREHKGLSEKERRNFLAVIETVLQDEKYTNPPF